MTKGEREAGKEGEKGTERLNENESMWVSRAGLSRKGESGSFREGQLVPKSLLPPPNIEVTATWEFAWTPGQGRVGGSCGLRWRQLPLCPLLEWALQRFFTFVPISLRY